MRIFVIFAAALWAAYPSISLAQVDPDWSRRELERMQAQQERWEAQVERQRAEAARQRAQRERGVAPETGGGGCALCNVISIFDAGKKKRRAKEAGKMLANGDCKGAEKFALEIGEFDLLDRVKTHCERATSTTALKEAREANWLLLAGEKGGLAFYADPKSIRDQGTHMSYWSRIVFPADNLVHEIRTLNFYRCRDRKNAIKYMVVHSRDGTVENMPTEDRDLKFEPLEPKTEAEKSLYNAACAPRSSSK